ncbi:hypothetical protein BD770DRAFT_397099 [Pilaira anomala]|nr:hypothetical protein BD770DRAFT_397099 [Pilaira anomala]
MTIMYGLQVYLFFFFQHLHMYLLYLIEHIEHTAFEHHRQHVIVYKKHTLS